MKKTAGFFASLVLLLQVGGAFAQSSDYEIISTYKDKHQSLLESIKSAQDQGQCDKMAGEINGLEADYILHRVILAEGLYPETFDTSIAALRKQLEKETERISAIVENKNTMGRIEKIEQERGKDKDELERIRKENEEHRAALEALTQKVKDQSAQIDVLSTKNTELLKSIKSLQLQSKKDAASIAELKALTEKLNANIQARDELIVKMMDGLFKEYSKSDLTDAQKKNLLVTVQGNDYVGKIVETIEGNINSVERTVMLPQDVELIKAEERKLSAKWNEIKPYVGKIYSDEQIGNRDLERVDTNLSKWRTLINETTWKSIHQVFVEKNVDIGTFGNAQEFQARLLAYIDEQMTTPARDKFQVFKNKVWDSPIKDQWLPVIPTDELTAQQRTDIEERIALWEKKISALLVRWVLIGASVLAACAAIAVAVVIGLRKKRQL